MATTNGKLPENRFGSDDEERRKAVIEHALRAIDELGQFNADKDPDEILAEVTAEVEAVRQERYERRKAAEAGCR